MSYFAQIKLQNEDGQLVNNQYPISSDGDSVYAKDIWIDESVVTDWIDQDSAGQSIAFIPFTDLHTRIQNSTANNPKVLLIHLNRSVRAQQVGIGCTNGGDFSNIKLTLIGSGGVERSVIDESSDSTKYTSRNLIFTNQLFNALKLEFYTADAVAISNLTIQKIIGVNVDQVEPTTNSLQTISYSHAELHSGHHYVFKGWHNIAKAGSHEHLIVTPDTTRWAHFTVGIDALTSTVLVEVFEGTITSADGTVGTTINRNRNHPDDNTTIIYESPTIISDGTLLTSFKLGAGKGSAGGSSRDSEELLLKQNTKYLLKVTELDIVATDVNFNFDWYEHTNKNII